MSDSNKITFRASMPPIDSALRYSGAGNGARLQLDIPENQIEHAAWLIAMRQCRLIITIEVEIDEKEVRNNSKPEIKRSSARRKPANP